MDHSQLPLVHPNQHPPAVMHPAQQHVQTVQSQVISRTAENPSDQDLLDLQMPQVDVRILNNLEVNVANVIGMDTS